MRTEHYLTSYFKPVSLAGILRYKEAYDSTLRAVILLRKLGGNADYFVPFQIISEKGLFYFYKNKRIVGLQ